MGAAAFYLLCLILVAWYPLNFAGELLKTFPSIGMRGPLAATELLAHGLVAMTCVAAGRALWIGSPLGPTLARVALVLAALAAVQSLYWSTLPSQTMPGDELPLAILAVAHSAGWVVFLRRSERVRQMET